MEKRSSLKLKRRSIMKILVIDDNPVHLEAAKITLDDHDLTLCSSHDDAIKS